MDDDTRPTPVSATDAPAAAVMQRVAEALEADEGPTPVGFTPPEAVAPSEPLLPRRGR